MSLYTERTDLDQQKPDPHIEEDSWNCDEDELRLLVLLYDLQEVSKPWESLGDGLYHGISDAELWIRLGWSQTKFTMVKGQLLSKNRVIFTPSGGLALTW